MFFEHGHIIVDYKWLLIHILMVIFHMSTFKQWINIVSFHSYVKLQEGSNPMQPPNRGLDLENAPKLLV